MCDGPRIAVLAITILLCSAPTTATETISYTYDALGRLTSTVSSGSVNNGITTTYTLDAADNRARLVVGGGADSAAAFSIAGASAAPGQQLVFSVTKSGASTVTTTVNFNTVNGTALDGSDYTATSGTLSFAAAETTKQIVVQSLPTSPGNRSFTAQLAGPTGGATIATGTATGTITAAAMAEITATNPLLNMNSQNSVGLALSSLATTNGHTATIASISPASGQGTAVIAGDGQSATYTAPAVAQAPACESGTTISFTIPYSIRDSDNGVVVSGSISVSVTGPAGGTPRPPAQCNRPTPVNN